LCIASSDDGVVHLKGLCKDELLLNPNAIVCVTGVGGHIGFVEGLIPKRTWFPKPAIEFLKAHLN
jgi:predicted alpha/beta-fold hydrolase